MSDTPNAPVLTLRDGTLQVSVWENQTRSNRWYSATMKNSYQDADGNWHDTQTFRFNDLLRIALLAREAYRQVKLLGAGRRDES